MNKCVFDKEIIDCAALTKRECVLHPDRPCKFYKSADEYVMDSKGYVYKRENVFDETKRQRGYKSAEMQQYRISRY